MTKVFFRADGNSQIGLGHIIRSCALAHMLRQHFICTFFVRDPSEYIKQEISKSGSSIEILSSEIDYHQEAQEWTKILSGKEIIVLDGYQFDTAYQKEIKYSGCKLVCIDDIHAFHFVADVVINHAGGASETHYLKENYTRLCLGFDYALLRSCFLKGVLNCSDELSRDRNVLICMGGADPGNDTLKLINTVAIRYPELHYDIVIGAAYQYKKMLTDFLNKSRLDCTVHQNLNADCLFQLMQSASKAICSPSSISIEYLSTGGELYLHKTADNQEEIYKYFIAYKLGFDVSQFIQPSSAFNKKLGAKYFDGKQAQRLLDVFQNLKN